MDHPTACRRTRGWTEQKNICFISMDQVKVEKLLSCSKFGGQDREDARLELITIAPSGGVSLGVKRARLDRGTPTGCFRGDRAFNGKDDGGSFARTEAFEHVNVR